MHSPEQQVSPRAMLAFFAGANDDIAAPPWTQWTNPTSIFQQPILTFAALFARMATWQVNLAQVKFPIYRELNVPSDQLPYHQRNLSARMVYWSKIFVVRFFRCCGSIVN